MRWDDSRALERARLEADRLIRMAPEERAAQLAKLEAALRRSVEAELRSRRVGDYVCIEELGQGGQGKVYRAWNTKSALQGRFVALKRLPSKEERPDQFRKEARSWLQVGIHRNVVGFYDAQIDSDGRPYLVAEYVAGGTLNHWLDRRHGGASPAEVVRLMIPILDGLQHIHERGVVHRDLKPDNVFVAGPVDDETPKIADFGIAKVEGLVLETMPSMTPGYGGPEQMLSSVRLFEPNPLIGPWTDVHALAVTLWFVLGGEDWCRSLPGWLAGDRRSLAMAKRVHRAFADSKDLLDPIDAALRRGASPKLPDVAWKEPGAEVYEGRARQTFGTAMFGAANARYASVDALGEALLPPLVEAAARYTAQAGKERRPLTTFRKTKLVGAEESARAAVEPIAPRNTASHATLFAEPMGVVFLPGPYAYARTGDKILGLSQLDGQIFDVPVPGSLASQIETTKWLVRGPLGGVGLIGPRHVVFVRGLDFSSMPLPKRADGEPVGAIQAAIGDGRYFGVVTEDAGEGGPELWLSADGVSWSAPELVLLGGDVHAIVSGPRGFFLAGGFRGKKARAAWVGYDGQTHIFATNMNDKPPLSCAVAGATGEAWAAGLGALLRFDPSGAAVEAVEGEVAPVTMGLDAEGVPWLVTEREVFRRHGSGAPIWKKYYSHPASAPPLVALGFAERGARVMDARGGGVLIKPADFNETVLAR